MVKKTDFNAKITEAEGKIPNITGLSTNSALTAVENKTPAVSILVTKTEYATEITKIKNDYVTTTALDARHKDLVQKTYFDAQLKKVNDKVSSNSTNVLSYEHKLKQRENTRNDLERDASSFIGKDLFERNYLVFQPIYKYFKKVVDSTNNNIIYVHRWQSDGLLDAKVTAPETSTSNDKAPVLECESDKIRLQFRGVLLKQKKAACSHKKTSTHLPCLRDKFHLY